MKVKIVNKSGFELPKYEMNGSAGMDVRAVAKQEDHIFTLQPGQRVLIPTGLYMEIPYGYEVQVRPRSGLALKQGITVLNSPGTIDHQYTGEIGIIVINHSKDSVTIAHGDRIAQIVLNKFETMDFQEVEELDATERGSNGFGSTGVK